MRFEGRSLLLLGVVTLSLYGEHLMHRWWPSDEIGACNGSALSRMILGTQHLGKAPTDEQILECSRQRRAGRLLIERVIPAAGLRIALGGIALMRRSRSVEEPSGQRRSRVI